jgi:hypothetical protein
MSPATSSDSHSSTAARLSAAAPAASRPSIPPSQLAKVLLLQHRTGVSDEQAMECVGWDLRWKVALGLPIDHHGWHPKGSP